jgi:hypothetical protein
MSSPRKRGSTTAVCSKHDAKAVRFMLGVAARSGDCPAARQRSMAAADNPRSERCPSFVHVLASAVEYKPKHGISWREGRRTVGGMHRARRARRGRRRGSGRAPWSVRARVDARARLWERSGRPGGGAYPRQSGGPGTKHVAVVTSATATSMDPRRMTAKKQEGGGCSDRYPSITRPRGWRQSRYWIFSSSIISRTKRTGGAPYDSTLSW